MLDSTVGQVLRDVRMQNGLTQADVGEIAFLDHSMVSSVERGKRRLPRDAARRLTPVLDNGFFALAVASDATDGAMVPVLNGDLVDISLPAFWLSAKKEAREKLEALQATVALAIQPPGSLASAEVDQLVAAMREVADALTASANLLAAACTRHPISWTRFWADYRADLQRRRLVRAS